MEYRIGTMNEAYTVGRTELINWLNELLETRYTKVEEVSNGLHSVFLTQCTLDEVVKQRWCFCAQGRRSAR